MVESLQEFLERFGALIRSTVVLAAAFIVLGVLQRVLSRQGGSGDGKRFRNQLIMSASLLFMILMVILALPITDEMRGQLLSLFGIVVSATIALSAPSTLSNAMAGIMLKLIRNFRSGDFITVGEHFGRVSARGLFHTEIQLPDRDLTTLPNLMLATNPVTVIRTSGTVVSATCSLGYDVHHAKVETLLNEAVLAAGLEEPFVQVLELGDFSVTYKAAGILKDVKSLLGTRSRLRVAMLDSLHAGGIEIASPDIRSIRSYAEDKAFVPRAPHHGTAKVAESVPVEVVFDKAEEAESEEMLEAQRDKLDDELRQARERAKEAADETTKVAAERTVENLERRLAIFDQRLARRKELAEQEGS